MRQTAIKSTRTIRIVTAVVLGAVRFGITHSIRCAYELRRAILKGTRKKHARIAIRAFAKGTVCPGITSFRIELAGVGLSIALREVAFFARRSARNGIRTFISERARKAYTITRPTWLTRIDCRIRIVFDCWRADLRSIVETIGLGVTNEDTAIVHARITGQALARNTLALAHAISIDIPRDTRSDDFRRARADSAKHEERHEHEGTDEPKRFWSSSMRRPIDLIVLHEDLDVGDWG